MRVPVLLCAIALCSVGQRSFTSTLDSQIRGAAIDRADLYTWGAALVRWNPATGASKKIVGASRVSFGEGGCSDGQGTLYLQDGTEDGPLVSISQAGKRTVWDRKVVMHNCIVTELLGHRGVLIMDHYGQVRFYEAPRVYQEVYSFYTASRQSGLLRTDVDHDGLPDIFAGNYWIRSPGAFDLPWRLFAINTRHETPDSATMSLALRGRELYAAQGHMREGLVLRYTEPADPTQIWTEQIIAKLAYPHALASAGNEIVIGENNGPGSRLFVTMDGDHLVHLGTTDGVHTAFVIGGRVLTVGEKTVSWWDLQRRR